MARKSSKESILDAAEKVVLEKGAAHMSLDLVAAKAGVSKGGLMYHFPTKESLLKEMITRLINEFLEGREKKAAQLKDSQGRLLKAEIMSVLDPNEKRDRMALSILAVVAQAPYLLEPLRQAHRDHLQMLQNSKLPFERAALVSLASSGLMFLELLHLTPYSALQRKNIMNEMMRLVDQMESPAGRS
ncbi:MAG: TetR/AcrR family transcriptional regulator [Candidatus Omnitrophica bacterium]|nr:TetR/AcrR family transcriptional regulator [Candidatus Omnitrophota bacterium]